MKQFLLVGLTLLFALPQPIVNCRTRPDLDPLPATATEDDPERLFAEAIEIYESGIDADVDLRLDEACLVWLKRGESEKVVRARMQFGDLYRKDKRFPKSIDQYQQALLLSGIAPALTASIYDSMGQIYAELYEPEMSFRYYRKALDLARSAKAAAIEVQVQLDLAIFYGKTGDLKQAIGLAADAVTSSSKADDEGMLARSVFVLGHLELKAGVLPKARVDLERALGFFRQQGDLPGEIRTLSLLSSLNLAAQKIALAQEQAEAALKLAEGQMKQAVTSAQMSRANGLRWPCWLALARALRASQRLDDARVAYYRAAAGTALDFWVTYNATDSSAIGFSEERQIPYRELVDLLMDLGRTEDAYYNYQFARIRALPGLIRARRDARGWGEKALDDRLTRLSTVMVDLRTRLLSPALSVSEREKLENELIEAENDATAIRVRSEMDRTGRRAVFSQPAKIKQLQQQMNGRAESIMEFDLGEDRSFVWLISAQDFSFEILPGREEIELRVRQYIDGLSKAPPSLFLQAELRKQRVRADELFTLLFGKLANKLTPNSNLIVIPDGLLNYLPFETLVNGGRYLLEDYQISYLPSASLIELLHAAPSASTDTEADQPSLLAFGDPLFTPLAKRTDTGKKPPVSSGEGASRSWGANAANLASLPRTRDEIEYIARLLPKERSHLYLGRESTEGAFKREKLRKYKWIHLATHSLIDDLNPDRSAVVLTSTGDPTEDGLLQAAEVMDLELDSDLVVLSACETGRGRMSAGEGIIGLSRAFLIAGARSLVVSQWPVSDISTAQLMQGFYERLVKGNKTAAALRQAKLKMLNGGKETRHPYYWAPFISIAAP